MLRAADSRFTGSDRSRRKPPLGLLVRRCPRSPGRLYPCSSSKPAPRRDPARHHCRHRAPAPHATTRAVSSQPLPTGPYPLAFCSPSAKDQFAGVLDNDDLSADDTLGRPRSRMARHLRNACPHVAQHREPNLPCSVPGKQPNAGTRPTNEGTCNPAPLFPSDDRRRPSPNAIVIRPSSAGSPPARESVFADLSNKRCVHSIAEHRGEHDIRSKPLRGECQVNFSVTCMLVYFLPPHLAHETAGTSGARHSIAPFISEG